MRTRAEIEAMRQKAYAEQGWIEDRADGSQRPVTWFSEEDRQARAFAEGVEAGLLYALRDAGDPFPARPDTRK